MAEDLLHGRQGDPLLEGQGRPGMAENVRGDLASELGAVRDPFDDLLGLTRPTNQASFRAKYGSRMARTRAESGTVRCLRREPRGRPCP